MIKWFKQLFCKHDLVEHHELHTSGGAASI